MERSESYPSPYRRGLAELMGRDPLGRRLEVEKKERYAQDLREQMKERRARQEVVADRGEQSSSPQRQAKQAQCIDNKYAQEARKGGWASPLPGTACRVALAETTTHTSPSPGHARSRLPSPSLPLGCPDTGNVADKVAQLQDSLKARLRSFEEERDQQWARFQKALGDQISSIRAAGHEAMLRQHDVSLQALRKEIQDTASRSIEDLRAELSDMKVALQEQHGNISILQGITAEHAAEVRSIREEFHNLLGTSWGTARSDLEALHGEVAELRMALADQLADLWRAQEGSAMLPNTVSILVPSDVGELGHDFGEACGGASDMSRTPLSEHGTHLYETAMDGQQWSGVRLARAAVPPQEEPSEQVIQVGSSTYETVYGSLPCAACDMDVARRRDVETWLASSSRHGEQLVEHTLQLQRLEAELQNTESSHRKLLHDSDRMGETFARLETEQNSVDTRILKLHNLVTELRNESMRFLGKLALRIEMVAGGNASTTRGRMNCSS